MALRLQRDYADGLNLLFVEAQKSSQADIEALALERKWFGTSAMWTREHPFLTGARGIPTCVLVDSDGAVVLTGHPESLHQQIETHVKRAKRERSKVPADVPRLLRAAWKSLAKGSVADAMRQAERVIARDPDSAAAARGLIADAARHAAAELERVERSIAAGRYAAAAELAEELRKALDGTELEQQAQARLERLAGADLEVEVAAESALRKLEKRLFAKGPDASTEKQLRRLAAKYPGTKAATQATHWASVCATIR